jgi:tRNA (guanosine-2'-O-)-methyltransferase
MRAGILAAFALAACAPGAPGAASPGANLAARGLSSTSGPVSACVPTGPEVCFNATDDNCNGIIDEGCGASTGVLQFMIAWGDSPADVDLSVVDPNGSKVHAANRSGASGLQLEKNCPDDGCHGQNVENVFLDGTDAPRGKYVVEVKLSDARGAELPVRVRLSVRIGSRTFGSDLVLSPEKGQEKQTLTFEL